MKTTFKIILMIALTTFMESYAQKEDTRCYVEPPQKIKGPSHCLRETAGGIGVEIHIDGLNGDYFWGRVFDQAIRNAILAQARSAVDTLNEHFSFLNKTFYLHRLQEHPRFVRTGQFSRRDTVHIIYRAYSIPAFEPCGAMRFDPKTGDHYILINITNPSCGEATSTKNLINQIHLDRTLVHEFGHYLSLNHTFYLSDTPFAENPDRNHQEGNRLTCSFWGDGFCDTPADPKFYDDEVNEQCEYLGDKRYSPDTKNFMSYSRLRCKEHFSEEQKQAMIDFLPKILCSASDPDASYDIEHARMPYPNPFKDKITIPIATNAEIGSVQIFDTLGRLVKEIKIPEFQAFSPYERVVEWDGSGLDGQEVPSGVYLAYGQRGHKRARDTGGVLPNPAIKIVKQ